MSFQSLPSQDGVYRIKCLDEDLYIESIPKSETTARYGRPWTRLVAPTGSTKQQWFLTLAPNLNGYRIQSAFDKKGLIFIKTSDTYRGYGFPYPDGDSTDWSGDTVHWQIFQRQGQQYATIGTPRSANNDLVFDSQQMYRSDGDYAVHFWPRDESSSAPHQRFVFQYVGPTPTPDPDEPDMKLDVVFLQDTTGSQQPYIDAARQHINNICIDLKKESGFKHDDDLRFRLIAFRDHPPQEPAFLLKPFDFTSSTTQLMNDLGGLRADGGGDGPEAQTDALDAALNSAWRDDAAKVVVLVTDAPPHGIEDSGDEFPDGCPLQLDPCRVVDLCADNGITLHIIGCEPTLSSDYTHAKDFYEGIAKKTNGDFVPLTKVDGDSTQLKAAVVGLAAKALDTQRLAKQLSARILAEAHRSHDAISADLHKDLSAQGVHHHQVLAANVYTSSKESNHNVNVWTQASSVKEAKNKLKKTSGSQLADQGRSKGSYAVSYTREPITRADTNAIVAKVLKKAGRRD